MRRLSVQEVENIKTIPILDHRKDAIQNIVIQEWAKKPQGVFVGFTSVGKSFCIAKVIRIINNKSPNSNVCIVVPTKDLRDDFLDLVAQFSLKNVDIFVVNSIAKTLVDKKITKHYDLLICDELHTLCNKKSKYFSEVLPRVTYKWFFGVSATLEKPHIEYLRENGLEIFFDIPIEDGYRTNVIPEYSIYNVPVKLTWEEKKRYFAIQHQYASIVSAFTSVDLNHPIDAINICIAKKDELIKYQEIEAFPKDHAARMAGIMGKKNGGVVVWMALTWQRLMTERRMLLNNCKDSLITTIKLAQHINEPMVIVCSSIDVINTVHTYLPNSLPYHSMLPAALRKENKRKFKDGEVMFLLVAKGLKQGYNNSKLRFLMRQGYTSKPLDLTQYLGRLLRPDKNNPDKYAVLINLYVDDFEFNGHLVESQQKKWLISSLYRRAFVEWVDNFEQIIL